MSDTRVRLSQLSSCASDPTASILNEVDLCRCVFTRIFDKVRSSGNCIVITAGDASLASNVSRNISFDAAGALLRICAHMNAKWFPASLGWCHAWPPPFMWHIAFSFDVKVMSPVCAPTLYKHRPSNFEEISPHPSGKFVRTLRCASNDIWFTFWPRKMLDGSCLHQCGWSHTGFMPNLAQSRIIISLYGSLTGSCPSLVAVTIRNR